jgi:hypothetical protein
MDCDSSGLCGLLLIALFIYWMNEQSEKNDRLHLSERLRRKNSEPTVIEQEDSIIREKALLRKYKAIAEYRSKYHVSVSCAQDIIDSILKEGTKAQSK